MAHYQRTASTITSGGNRKPANAERGGTGTTARRVSRMRRKPVEEPSLSQRNKPHQAEDDLVECSESADQGWSADDIRPTLG
jgi:hypothetical protein